MSTNPPDEPSERFRARFSRDREPRAQTHGQQLLARCLRVLDGKSGITASDLVRIAHGRLAPQPKSAVTSAIRAAARSVPQRSRNTRGAGVRTSGRHAQRVIVKARIGTTRGKNPDKAIRQHLAYIERDGVDRDGGSGRMFGSAGTMDRDQVDAFAERCAASRHQFRFIVSPERGVDLDLDRMTRDLLRRMELDVGTRLDYAACVHHDTDQPHVHIVVNGKNHRGGDLVISRDYIGSGLRQRAMDWATNELGYRTDIDLFQSLARDVRADRFTAIDRRLQTVQERDAGGLIDLRATPAASRAVLQRRLQLGRLAYLRDAGLADEVSRGVWRLRPDAIERLRGYTQHREIQRQVERHLQPADRAASVDVIDKAKLASPVIGKVLGRGLANELSGTHYLVVSGIDGKTYYTALSPHSERHLAQGVRRGDIVALKREISQPTGQADRNFIAIAARNSARYDPERHLADLQGQTSLLPFGATPERFVAAHVARLDALASRGHVAREADGKYRVPPDLIARLAVDTAPARDDAFVKVERCARGPVRDLADVVGHTWLDDQLIAGQPHRLRQAAVRNSFQDELIEAADRRAQRLIQLGLATLEGGTLRLDPQLRGKLSTFELDAAAQRLGRQHGQYVDLDRVREFTGRVVAIESLESGPQAVVVSGQHFTLAPADRGPAQLVGKEIALSLDTTYSFAERDERQKARVRFQALDAMERSPSLGLPMKG